MDRFETPNPNELKPEVLHNYDLLPKEYPITDNRTTNTYDQFIMLRDTLVYSKKYYEWKAWATLIVGQLENTVEVKRQNMWKQKMNSWWRWGDKTQLDRQLQGPYVEQLPVEMVSEFGTLSIRVLEDWYYRIMHKEEVINIPDGAKKVYCYVEHYEQDQNGNYPRDPDTEELLPWNPIAVFDRESKSGADYMIGDLFEKMTSFGIIERNLKRWDILALRMVYLDENDEYQDVTLQDNRSNRWSVEYLNLPLKN